MGQLNIKDEALIAEAKALAELLGTSATDAVRQAVHERLGARAAGARGGAARRNSRRSWQIARPPARLVAGPASASDHADAVRPRRHCRGDRRQLRPRSPSCTRNRKPAAYRRRHAATHDRCDRRGQLVEAAMVSRGPRPAAACGTSSTACWHEAGSRSCRSPPSTPPLAATPGALGQGQPSGRTQLRRLLRLCPGKERSEPLLFKGDDFSQTDVKAALKTHARALIELFSEEIPARMQARAAEDLCAAAAEGAGAADDRRRRGRCTARAASPLVGEMAARAETPGKEERGPRISAPDAGAGRLPPQAWRDAASS